MRYKGFYIKISPDSNIHRVDKKGRDIICEGFLIQVFADETERIEINNFSAAVGFEILENSWFCQYHLTHFIRTRIMQRERYDHSRAFFELPEAAHRWRCRFFC